MQRHARLCFALPVGRTLSDPQRNAAASSDFLEYFAGGDCDKAVNVAVGITGPYYHGRTLTATQAYPSYGASGGCNHSAVRK